MATENRPTAWRNDARDQLYLTFTVATSSIINTTFTANHTFSRAFLAAPMVFGSVVQKAGASSASVIANATSMSVYLRGLSPTAYTDEVVTVNVTLEGGY